MAAVPALESSCVAPGQSSRFTKTWILAAIVVLTQTLGNFALTWGLKQHSQELGFSPAAYVEIIFTPWVAAGITLLVIWLLSRMTLMSWADLSFVLPATSVGYVLSAIIGKYFFGERISSQRWLAILLIVAGTALTGMTRPNTTEPEAAGH